VPAYGRAPFICGNNFTCQATYYLDDETWYIHCNEGLQGIRCHANDTGYEQVSGEPHLYLVHCIGKTMLMMDLTLKQWKM